MAWHPHPNPTDEVHAEAARLLPLLWRQGAGSSAVVNGVCYRAEYHGEKKGVTAYVNDAPPTYAATRKTTRTNSGAIWGLALLVGLALVATARRLP
jgi:hypothetical protein